MYISKFSIEKSKAVATYGKLVGGAVEINAGSKKNRLTFSSKTNGSMRTEADVYVEVIGKSFSSQVRSFFLSLMNRAFVKSTYNGKTIYINIRSLSNRLGIPTDEIYKAAKSKDKLAIDKLIANYHKDYIQTEEKVDEQFNKIIREKYLQENDKIKTPEGREISKVTLRYMLGIAAFSKFNSKNEEEVGYILKDKSILHLQKQEDSEWPLVTLFSSKVLGEGFFGKVQIVQELSIGRQCIAKIPNRYGIPDAENEVKILNKIYRNNPNCKGIQKKPFTEFNFKLEKSRYFGYTAPQYDGVLTKAIPNLKTEEKIDCARQLLSGLVELQKQQIGHGDLKEENCLFKKNNDGSTDYVISDFGGAVNLDEKANWPKLGTPYYRILSDAIAYQALQMKSTFLATKQEKKDIEEDIKKLVYARDLYAMGLIFKNIFNKSISNKQQAKELLALINEMTDNSWDKRISTSDALARFNTIFPSNS